MFRIGINQFAEKRFRFGGKPHDLKRSSPFKFDAEFSAFACCNFSAAIEPEVSTTKTTSFGAGLVSFTVGAARIRK